MLLHASDAEFLLIILLIALVLDVSFLVDASFELKNLALAALFRPIYGAIG